MVKMQTRVLKNGLTVFYFPKKGYAKSFAVLATDYGAVDATFKTNKGTYDTPLGVAHFLEHKMFEQQDGTNALALFAKTGASPNAFTSQTMTAYHFECTENFSQNLEILLDFVANPYFTKENVDKEQGIIGQEIKMVEDNPNWICYTNMFRALYENHPIKNSIIGTIDSIAQIDADTLYLCHNAFYNASNMALCVAGDLDFDSICKTCEEIYPMPDVKLESRDYSTEPSKTLQTSISETMEVAMPLFMIGFKDNFYNSSDIKYQIIAEIATEYFASKSSKLYNELYNHGLIDRSFEAGYSKFKQGGTLMFGGQSKNPELVYQTIKTQIEDVLVNSDELSDIKNAYIGAKVRVLDSFDDLCVSQIDAFFNGYNFDDYIKTVKDISEKDILNFFNNIKVHSAISIVKPKN